MAMFGIPAPSAPPEFKLERFKIYIPKLAWYCDDKENRPLYELAVEKMSKRLNYSYWLEDWEEAMSLAVAHFIIITDPRFAQATGEDATAGGVMKSRSVGNLSYDYDIDYYLPKSTGYEYWITTGYGRRLAALSLQRGFIGVFTGD